LGGERNGAMEDGCALICARNSVMEQVQPRGWCVDKSGQTEKNKTTKILGPSTTIQPPQMVYLKIKTKSRGNADHKIETYPGTVQVVGTIRLIQLTKKWKTIISTLPPY